MGCQPDTNEREPDGRRLLLVRVRVRVCGPCPHTHTPSSGADLGLVALLELLLDLDLPLLEAHLGLHAHDRSARLEPRHPGVVEVLHAVLLKVAELGLVGLVDRGEAEGSRVLLVHEGTEARLVLDDAVRHVHLAAEGRQPNNELDRVDVRRDDHELRLLLLNKRGHVLEAELDSASRALGVDLLAVLGSLGSGEQARLLVSRGLRAVLREELEEGGGLVLGHGVRELVHRRRHREALHEHLLLALEAHVARPFDEAAEVAAGGPDVTADAEVARAGREERIRRLLRHLLRLLLLSLANHGA
mmetsp:Transcript_9036/g.16403  ORF Transcript_9036/g.16403 Transcript_9036/m.16403 type:complete len:302 (+) Transcript_9036:369-1274(+)